MNNTTLNNSQDKFSKNVFINCPFDEDYEILFQAIVFSIIAAGCEPRCAKELSESGDIRIQRIINLVKECKFGIHDISRTGDRLNMPFELGIFVGARYFNEGRKDTPYLIMNDQSYEHQKKLSDISGQDTYIHNNSPEEIVKIIFPWLKSKINKKKKEIDDEKLRKILEYYKIFCKNFTSNLQQPEKHNWASIKKYAKEALKPSKS